MSDRQFCGYAVKLRFYGSLASLTIAIGLLLTGCPSPPTSGQETTFKAPLTGSQASPPVVFTTSGAATGSGTFTLNAAQTQLSFNIHVSGMSGPVTAAHFHSGIMGLTGPAVYDISSTVVETNGQVSATGTWTLDEADFTNLMAGHIYVDFHTAAHVTGEVRGQLTRNP